VCRKDDGEVVYRSSIVNGVPMMDFVTQSKMDMMRKEVTLTANDIVVQTYPRCGTTWMQQIVLSLLAGAEKCAEIVTDPMAMSPWIEHCVSGYGPDGNWTHDQLRDWRFLPDGPTPRRVLKTHGCAHLSPWVQEEENDGAVVTIPQGAKVIVVTRNPLDTCVSMYHHTVEDPIKEYTGDFNNFFDLYLEGKVESGGFWEWHAGWLEAQRTKGVGEKILWISFEDMKRDLRKSIERVGAFIFDEAPSSDLVDAVHDCSTFEAMKATAAKMDEMKRSKGERVKEAHIRKGKVGGWKDLFCDGQYDRFVANHNAKCASLEIDPKLWDILSV